MGSCSMAGPCQEEVVPGVYALVWLGRAPRAPLGLVSLGAGIAGCWHCAFALVLCVVCSPGWFVLLCCKLGDCCQFGVPCPGCAVVLIPSMAFYALSLP